MAKAVRKTPKKTVNVAKKARMASRTKPASAVSTHVEAEADPRLAKIAKAYASDKRVTLGKLFASVGLSVGGKIFAMVVRGQLVVKLPKSRVDELVERGEGQRFDPGHGRIMKEWLTFSGPDARWAGLAREAYEYVGSAAAGRK